MSDKTIILERQIKLRMILHSGGICHHNYFTTSSFGVVLIQISSRAKFPFATPFFHLHSNYNRVLES